MCKMSLNPLSAALDAAVRLAPFFVSARKHRNSDLRRLECELKNRISNIQRLKAPLN